jgi:hypothetical protein
VHDPHVSRQGVVAAEALLLRAQLASNLLLPRVVKGILVSRKIVGSTEDRVARLARGRVDPLALVGTGLAVPCKGRGSHLGLRRTALDDRRRTRSSRRSLSVTVTLVLLELRRSLEAEAAAMVGTGVGARLGRRPARSRW